MARICDLNAISTIVLAACSLIACSDQSSKDVEVDQPSGELNSSGAAVDATSTLAASSVDSDKTAESVAQLQTVPQAQIVAGTEDKGADLLVEQAVEEQAIDEQDLQKPQAPDIGAANSVDFCDGFVADADPVVIPQLNKPGYLDPYIDPAFGSRVVRITDSEPGEVNKPAYSSMQAWNADESYLLIYRTGTDDSGHKLLDGNTYEFIRDLNITPSDIEQVFWSHTDADILYYISKALSRLWAAEGTEYRHQ